MENKTFDLQTAYDQSKSLELAQTNSEAYTLSNGNSAATISTLPPNFINNEDQHTSEDTEHHSLAATYKKNVFFYVVVLFTRNECVQPAKHCVINVTRKVTW